MSALVEGRSEAGGAARVGGHSVFNAIFFRLDQKQAWGRRGWQVRETTCGGMPRKGP
jgi:hypothetical protein